MVKQIAVISLKIVVGIVVIKVVWVALPLLGQLAGPIGGM